MQAQKQSKPRPAASFQLHESEGMQDLLSLMQNMSVGGGEELPQANGDLGGHAHATEGTTLPYFLGDTDQVSHGPRWWHEGHQRSKLSEPRRNWTPGKSAPCIRL